MSELESRLGAYHVRHVHKPLARQSTHVGGLSESS